MTDPLFYWRLHNQLDVPSAVILMLGGDPGQTTLMLDGELMREVQFRDYPNYKAAFGAVAGAILRGEIEARIAYGLIDAGSTTPDKSRFRIVAARDFWTLLKRSAHDPSWISESGPPVQISSEPDWDATMVEVESLRQWLRSKGAVDGFFVSSIQDAGGDAFNDVGHEHFSAELALAVTAWRALAGQQRFPRGPKAAIEAWIDAHPEAWQGDSDLSGSARERIVTLINWRKGGGAPASG